MKLMDGSELVSTDAYLHARKIITSFNYIKNSLFNDK